jgi:hypothetical protein
LHEHADRLREVYRLHGHRTLVLTSRFEFMTGRVTVAGSSRTRPAHAVTVVLKLEGKQPLVYTAFPDL